MLVKVTSAVPITERAIIVTFWFQKFIFDSGVPPLVTFPRSSTFPALVATSRAQARWVFLKLRNAAPSNHLAYALSNYIFEISITFRPFNDTQHDIIHKNVKFGLKSTLRA